MLGRLAIAVRAMIRTRHRVFWLVLWGVTFVVLGLSLPLRPVWRITRGEGLQRFYRFADSHTVLLADEDSCSDPRIDPARNQSGGQARFDPRIAAGPLTFLDLTDGSIHRIEIPDNKFAVRSGLMPGSEAWAAASGWFFEGCRLHGDFVYAIMSTGEEKRLHIWNWRTSEEILRRPVSGLDVGLVGDRIWLQSSKMAHLVRPEFVDISTGRSIKSDLFAGQYDLNGLNHRPDRLPTMGASPDGRYLVGLWYGLIRVDRIASFDPPAPELRVTPVVAGFAFSADSQRLATLTSWTPDNPHRRVWQINDLATGRQIAHHVETREGEVDDLANPDAIAFLDDSLRVVASGHSGEGLEIFRGGLQPVEIWDSFNNSVQSIAPGATQLEDADQWKEPGQPLRFVTADRQLIDVTTGKELLRLDELESCEVVSNLPRWAITTVPDSLEGSPLARLIAPYSISLAKLFRQRPETRLRSLATGRTIAHLAPRMGVCLFSSDCNWLVTDDRETINVWRLPDSPISSLGAAFLWSLFVPLVPLLVTGVRQWRRRRLVARGGASVGP